MGFLSPAQILDYTRTLLTGGTGLGPLIKRPSPAALFGLPLLVAYELCQYAAGDSHFYERLPTPVRGALYATMLFLIAMGSSNEPTQFIYFQF